MKWGGSESHYSLGGWARIYISGVEGSQAVPARPSGRGNEYDIAINFYDVGSAALQ
jgi:hypothetical protein